MKEEVAQPDAGKGGSQLWVALHIHLEWQQTNRSHNLTFVKRDPQTS